MLILDPSEPDLWERFQSEPLTERDVDAHPVLRRWLRARALRAQGVPQGVSRPNDAVLVPEQRDLVAMLLTRASELLDSACADLHRRGFAVVLADHDGVILMSRGVELLRDPYLRAEFADGMRLSEDARGTNAIGTALAEQASVAVIGQAHYETGFRQLCCYASPIRDAGDRTVAVLDISGPCEGADPLLGTVVQSLAATLEATLRVQQYGAHGPLAIEPQLDPILEALPVAVWIANSDGQITRSNDAARRLWAGELHVPPEEYDRFKAWWPDGRRVSSAEWGLQRALKSGEVIVDEEVQIEAFDGSHKFIRNLAAPILDGAGRVVGGVAVNEDLTFSKQAEATRDLFVGILGHDLRSPLGAIKMATSLLQKRGEQGELPDLEQRALARVQSSASRIESLVDSLLDFTRARFGMGFPVHPTDADMGELGAHLVDEVRTAHPDRMIRFEAHGSLRGCWDVVRVAQVLSNLVGNAVQHGKDPIVVEARDAGDVVLLSVRNGGQPIPEAKRAALFQPFRKSDDSKGVGLGLFIAQQIVRSHGGSIDVASTPEATTFTTRWLRAVQAHE
jgi:signal transduction histidine kinase